MKRTAKVGLYYHDEDKAEQRSVLWRFAARVDVDSVDAWETVMHHLNPDLGRAEDEIRFFKHAPVYVLYAEEIGYDRESDGPSLENASYSVERVVEINDTRRC